MRLPKLDIPKLSVIPDWTDPLDNTPLLSEVAEFCMELKRHGRSKPFLRVDSEQTHMSSRFKMTDQSTDTTLQMQVSI